MFDDDWELGDDTYENFKTKHRYDDKFEDNESYWRTPSRSNQSNSRTHSWQTHSITASDKPKRGFHSPDSLKKTPTNSCPTSPRDTVSSPKDQKTFCTTVEKGNTPEPDVNEVYEVDSEDEAQQTTEHVPDIDDLLVNTPSWVICCVCDEVFKSPRITPNCAHTFCMKCIEAVLNTNNPICPLCRTPLPPRDAMLPNHQLMEVMDSLQSRCRWGVKVDKQSDNWVPDLDGCQSILTLAQFDLHTTRCQYALVKCVNTGCSKN